jgi:hypothetical protein
MLEDLRVDEREAISQGWLGSMKLKLVGGASGTKVIFDTVVRYRNG